MGRAIAAVVVGFVAWTVLWLGGGAGLNVAFPDAAAPGEPIDDAGYLVSALVLSVVCSLVAGLLASLITRGRGRATLVLGIVLLLVGIGVQAGFWKLMPVWYHVPFLVLIVPVVLAGGRLAARGKGGHVALGAG